MTHEPPSHERPADHQEADFTPHPGINFSNMPVAGNAAGIVFVVGSIAVILLGLPEARPFFIASGAGGLLIGVALLAWHRWHRSR